MSEPRSGLLGALQTRLPLLLVLAVGFFFWRGGLGLFATERTLIWKLPASAALLREVDLQVWNGERLLKRGVLQLPRGLSEDPVWKLALRPGRYPVKAFLRSEGEPPKVLQQELIVSDDETLVVQW